MYDNVPIITINIPNRKLMSINFDDIRGLCCCKTKEIDQQTFQENYSLQYNRNKFNFIKQPTDTHPQIYPNHPPNRTADNFKYNKWRPSTNVQPINKKTIISTPDFQLGKPVSKSPVRQHNFKPITIARIPPHIITKPPTQLHQLHQVRLVQVRSPVPISSQVRTYLSPTVAPLSPRITITVKNALSASRMQGKRIRTVEEETQYSSKHSQIQFKNTSACDTMDNPSYSTFQKRNSNNRISKNFVFQDDLESLKFVDACKSGSCQEVSAREEVDHSLSNEFLTNARTIQTINTSTELEHRTQSRQLQRAYTFFQNSRSPGQDMSPIISKDKLYENRLHEYRFEGSGSHNLSQGGKQTNSPQMSGDLPQTPELSFKMLQSPISPPNFNENLFYADSVSKKPCRSPKISVLEIDQNSEQQQLRDVIDHNFLKSQYVSKNNSPFISLNQSLKNVSEQKEKKEKKLTNYFQFSPQHSRQASEQFTLFKETRSKLQRTNTFESIGSQSSENSYLDVKFMQKMRSRRGVSRLV